MRVGGLVGLVSGSTSGSADIENRATLDSLTGRGLRSINRRGRPPRVVAKVLEVRQSLSDDPVANVGALTIVSELERERFAPIPSLRTIDRILNAAGVTGQWTRHERSGNKLPLPVVTTPGIWQQADWIQDR